MKTTGCKEIKPKKAEPPRYQRERLYPNLGEMKRLEKAYKELGLDFDVIRRGSVYPGARKLE